MDDKDRRVCPAEHAGALDNMFRRWIQNPKKILKDFVREGMTVVDFGCGPGFFTVNMAEMVGPGGKVFGVDLQQEMLAKVSEKIVGTDLEPRIVLHHCSPASTGLQEMVDFVLAFYVLHELPNQRDFFTEMASILKKQGKMLVVEPPFHVSAKAFAETLELAADYGFVAAAGPRLLFSKTAVLSRN